MAFKDLFKGNYKAFIKCSNCGFNSEIRIPKGISVADYVKGGSCICDNCKVVGYPKEYTTKEFETDKNKIINKLLKPMPKKEYTEEDKGDIQWLK